MKKIFRIELFSLDCSWIKDIALIAAISNGGKNPDVKINIDGLEFYAKVKRVEWEANTYTITRTSPHSFTIDKETVCFLSITEVEVFDLDLPQVTASEARDILEEIRDNAPTLSNTGINDSGNMEALN